MGSVSSPWLQREYLNADKEPGTSQTLSSARLSLLLLSYHGNRGQALNALGRVLLIARSCRSGSFDEGAQNPAVALR